jgi:hypothetical protein
MLDAPLEDSVPTGDVTDGVEVVGIPEDTHAR